MSDKNIRIDGKIEKGRPSKLRSCYSSRTAYQHHSVGLFASTELVAAIRVLRLEQCSSSEQTTVHVAASMHMSMVKCGWSS